MTETNFRPAAQRQSLVKVSGIDGYFLTKTGGDTSSDTSKVYDGGNPTPAVIASPAETDNITVSRGWDNNRDNPLLRRLRPLVGKFRATVSVTPTDEDLVAQGEPTVYSDALLVRMTDPEADGSSGDAKMFELEFAIGSVQ